MIVDQCIVLDGKSRKCNNHSRISIDSTNMGYPKKNKLYVLIYMDFVPKIVCFVGNRVCLTFCAALSPLVVVRVDTWKRLLQSGDSNTYPFCCQHTYHSLPSVGRANLININDKRAGSFVHLASCTHSSYTMYKGKGGGAPVSLQLNFFVHCHAMCIGIWFHTFAMLEDITLSRSQSDNWEVACTSWSLQYLLTLRVLN